MKKWMIEDNLYFAQMENTISMFTPEFSKVLK
jgi:hypothetical protein